MQFISFIASTMLIVLISQYSIMGLPVNHTVVEESCLEGFELVKGECTPVDSTTNINEIETSSLPSEDVIVHEEESVIKVIIPKKSGACPEGMEHGVHGICQEINLSDTTEVNVELTTDINESQGGVENLKGCPEGTEQDERGACQEIKPSNSTKIISNPKNLLKKDGSCPDTYKMIDGRCLYIKSKTNSTFYRSGSTSGDHVSTAIRPKSSVDDSSKVELVPVLSDNSCPEGTEYSEYGLCQKRTRLPKSNPRMKADGSCADNFRSINGTCLYKDSTIRTQPKLTKTTISKSVNTTFVEEPISDPELFESTTVEEASSESQSEETSSPL